MPSTHQVAAHLVRFADRVNIASKELLLTSLVKPALGVQTLPELG